MSEPVTTTPETPRSRGRGVTRQTWAERLARFPASGLSPAQFCAAEGVSLPSFYAWKRRLTAEGLSGSAASPTDTVPGPRWLPVRLPGAGAAVELVLPGGALLRIPAGCDLAFVRALVQVLGGAPC